LGPTNLLPSAFFNVVQSNWTAPPGSPSAGDNALLTYYTNTSQVFQTKVPPFDNYSIPVVNQQLNGQNGNHTGPEAASADILGAAYFQCPMRRMARQVVAHNTGKAYLYSFGFYPPTSTIYVQHGITQFYWVRTPSVVGSVTASNNPSFYDILNALTQMWLSFIVNGDPSDTSGLTLTYGVNTTLPQWMTYNATQDNFLQIGVDDQVNDGRIFMSNGYYEPKCTLWDGIITYDYYTPRCSTGFTLQNNGTDWSCV
jgi:hypothetical protein